MKIEYEPLFQAGFHDITSSQLEQVFLNPFPDSAQRKYLIQRFKAFLANLDHVGINFEIWLDGSFSTQKPDPEDIDLVLLCSKNDLNNITNEQMSIFNDLTKNKNICKIRYGCDVYLCYNEDEPMKSYWRGWFGFSRNETAKGIPRLKYVCDK